MPHGIFLAKCDEANALREAGKTTMQIAVAMGYKSRPAALRFLAHNKKTCICCNGSGKQTIDNDK